MRNLIVKVLVAFGLLVLINLASEWFYKRFDITEDGRFTLSTAAEEITRNFDGPVIIDVLLGGNVPAEFAKLKTECLLLLDQYRSKNTNVTYNLIDPLEGSDEREQSIADLQQIGLNAASVTIQEDGKVSQELVFPWAMVNYGNKTVRVPLLKNKLGSSTGERINNSIQQLEYAFADAFAKLQIKEKKKIAVIKGNGELADIYMADFLTSLREYYNIGAITLDSVSQNPQEVFNKLSNFDLALIAKPSQTFSDSEKFVLDQFMVNGGKSVWLVDQVAMELDSLLNENGSGVATPRDLNLNDFFFRYGVRINPVLVNDAYNTPIVLASGEGNDSQYNPLPWVYHPMVFSKENHPINKNIEAVRLQFTGTIDTLQNKNKKTVLLYSSPLSKEEGTPKPLNLGIINNQIDAKNYSGSGNRPLAVLIEGEFNSAFRNRVKPFNLTNLKDKGPNNMMLVIADGDIIKNQLRNGVPLELGYDKWTNSFYGNKEFLLNSISYMLDDNGLINIRSKDVIIPLLDSKKIVEQKTKWQLINIGVPVILTLLAGFGFNLLRKRKYSP